MRKRVVFSSVVLLGSAGLVACKDSAPPDSPALGGRTGAVPQVSASGTPELGQSSGVAGDLSRTIASSAPAPESCLSSAGAGATIANANAAGAPALPLLEEAHSALAIAESPAIGDAEFQAVVAAVNQFGLELFQRVVSTETGNVVFSPVSTAYALAMTYLGANANTRLQMAAVLHDAFVDDRYHAGMGRLATALANRNVVPHQTEYGCMFSVLQLNNSVWVQRGLPLLSSYLDPLAMHYGAGVPLVDFANSEGARSTINQWVAAQTNQRISNLLPPGSITSNTRLVLTDTVYFKGWWAQPFPIENTYDDAFTLLDGSIVTIPMMHEARIAKFAGATDYAMVDLPYDGKELSMAFVLPAYGKFSTLRDSVTQAWLAQAFSELEDAEGKIAIPKFGFSWGTKNFAEPLKAMGMSDAFSPSVADFSRIETTLPLHVHAVYHQAFIGVDESSTVATAATAVDVPRPSICCFGGPPEVVLNRPFLFFLHDKSGVVLFAGQVLDPTQTGR